MALLVQFNNAVKPLLVFAAAPYGAIGAFHYIFRHKFLAISMDPRKAEAEGISIKAWDFLFYAIFGWVVTSLAFCCQRPMQRAAQSLGQLPCRLRAERPSGAGHLHVAGITPKFMLAAG